MFVNIFRKIAAKEIKEAWKRREARYKRNPNTKVRKFEFLPKKFDPEAEDYSKMIGPLDQLDPRQKTVPPLILAVIRDKGIAEVVKLIIDGSLPILDVACHSQAGRHPQTVWTGFWTFLTPPPSPQRAPIYYYDVDHSLGFLTLFPHQQSTWYKDAS